MEKNREFHELVGLCWHYPVSPAMSDVGGAVCKKCKQPFDGNPDYATDPRLVLREMTKLVCWNKFTKQIFMLAPFMYMLDTTGKLRDAAIEFMRKEMS